MCLTLPPLPYTYACLQPKSPTRTPTEFSAALPLHASGTHAPRFEEVAQAGFCTGAASQAVRKVALTCLALTGGVVGTLGAGAGNGAEVPARALGGWGKSR